MTFLSGQIKRSIVSVRIQVSCLFNDEAHNDTSNNYCMCMHKFVKGWLKLKTADLQIELHGIRLWFKLIPLIENIQ